MNLTRKEAVIIAIVAWVAGIVAGVVSYVYEPQGIRIEAKEKP